MFLSDNKIKKEGKKVLATVIEVKEIATTDGTSYKPLVEFKNHRGETIIQELDYSTGFKPKQEVPYKKEIYYLEINNKIKIVPSNNKLKNAISIGFIIVGLAIFYLFIVLFKNKFL